MPDSPVTHFHSIPLARLKPTQLTVGMLQVQHKRKRLRMLEKKPSELIDFILEHPIRVVLGPAAKAYVIDHHHLALALIKEKFETAPMAIEEDWSSLPVLAFWKKMRARQFVHLEDMHGERVDLHALPKHIRQLRDDPYRSLAGFVREAGGFEKVQTPFAEFHWADFYRSRIEKKRLRKHFAKALREAMKLAAHKEACELPGYLKHPKSG